MAHFDIFIIGGGINGCGIARDAAGRGYDVCLCEQNDLASGTSSKSTKLIHGGLRYLEHYEFRLVREALKEREILWQIAPHIISPMRFILPLNSATRPSWIIKLGLFLYDNLAPRINLPPSQKITLRHGILQDKYTTGFEYSDAWVDDARLVVLNAMSARDYGAKIRNYTKVLKTEFHHNKWHITTQNTLNMQETTDTATQIINATGAWLDKEKHPIRLVQGSHIIVPALFQHQESYIFQQDDKRIIFAIPYLNKFTLIGTTDKDFNGDVNNFAITNDEINYLIAAANGYFQQKLTPDDIIASYSGLRPLVADGKDKASQASRDYELKMTEPNYLTIYGGKITTYRQLALSALKKIQGNINKIPHRGAWTHLESLTGGNFNKLNKSQILTQYQEKYNFLTPELITHYFNNYGTNCDILLKNCLKLQDLGKNYGDKLYESEINYLKLHEFACKYEDIIWRRTKLGYFLTPKEIANFAENFS